jgi:hypothetical protein
MTITEMLVVAAQRLAAPSDLSAVIGRPVYRDDPSLTS